MYKEDGAIITLDTIINDLMEGRGPSGTRWTMDDIKRLQYDMESPSIWSIYHLPIELQTLYRDAREIGYSYMKYVKYNTLEEIKIDYNWILYT